MRADAETARLRARDGIDKIFQLGAAVAPAQLFVVHRLEPHLEPEMGLTRELREEIEHVVRHAVRPRGDGEAGDARTRGRLAIEAREFFPRPVVVRVALKIPDELLRAVAALERPRALRELLGDRRS